MTRERNICDFCGKSKPKVNLLKVVQSIEKKQNSAWTTKTVGDICIVCWDAYRRTEKNND